MGSDQPSLGGEILSISGELDVSSVASLKERITATEASVVRLDVAAVTFIDSTGLAGLLDAQATIEAEGRRLELTNCPPVVTRLLQITALTDRFGLSDPGDR